MEADQLTTSILDDVFFIIKKCVKRAIGTLLFLPVLRGRGVISLSWLLFPIILPHVGCKRE
jgi:hypothetical protein